MCLEPFKAALIFICEVCDRLLCTRAPALFSAHQSWLLLSGWLLSHLHCLISPLHPQPLETTIHCHNSLCFSNRISMLVFHCCDKIFDIENVERVVWVHGFRPDCLSLLLHDCGKAEHHDRKSMLNWEVEERRKRSEEPYFQHFPRACLPSATYFLHLWLTY